jgi:hypothetical protein
MSNNKKSNQVDVNFGNGYAVYDSLPESLVGRVLPIIEAMGLKDSQEVAVKGMIRSTIYTVFYDENKPVYLDRELHTLIRTRFYDKEKKANIECVPIGSLKIEDIK